MCRYFLYLFLIITSAGYAQYSSSEIREYQKALTVGSAKGEIFLINAIRYYTEVVDSNRSSPLQLDTLFMLYDLAGSAFNKKPQYVDQKSILLWKYYKKDTSKYREIASNINTSISLNGKKTDLNNLKNKIAILSSWNKRMQFTNSDLIDSVITMGKLFNQAQKKDSIQQALYDHLALTNGYSCEYVDKIIAPKLSYDSIKSPKEIVSLSHQLGCKNYSWYSKSMQMMLQKEPNLVGYFQLGVGYVEQKQYKEAVEVLQKCISISPKSGIRERIYFTLAQSYFGLNNKPKAVSMLDSASSFGTQFQPQIQELWGDMYYASEKECHQPNSVLSALCFMAALEKYELANATEKINLCKEKLPEKSLLTLYRMQEGQKVTAKCWIGEVTIRAKE